MSERAYTVRELDDLRFACEMRWLFGSSHIPDVSRSSRSYIEHEKVSCVEELVRTSMLAGHTAQDIRDEDERRAQCSAAKHA